MLETSRIDEARVLAQIDRVLDLERSIKRSQIRLLVRIKNTLDQEQQAQLRRARRLGTLMDGGR